MEEPSQPADALQGEWLTRTPREDLRLLGRAIKEGWDIPEAAFTELPEGALEIFRDKTLSVRKRMSGLNALLKMHGQNMRPTEPQGLNGLTVNVAVQATQRETNGLTDEELEKAIDERIRLLAAIEAKDVRADG